MELPTKNNGGQPLYDVNIPTPGLSTSVTDSSTTLIQLIQLINSTIWFAIAGIAMGLIVYGGIKLITAKGEEKELKSANEIIIGAVVGILIALFAYVVVRLTINLFG